MWELALDGALIDWGEARCLSVGKRAAEAALEADLAYLQAEENRSSQHRKI